MSKSRTRVLVLAGGRSEEHEVSIVSTRSLMRALEGSALEVTPLVVTKEGRWLPVEQSMKALADGQATSGGELVLARAAAAANYDVVFPLIHGPNGEDGTVQGMFELAGIPYVGSGVLASALCMDKVMCKDLLRGHDIPQVAYRLVRRSDYERDTRSCVAPILELPPPWFVKPANLGSSVGVTKVKSEADLHQALRLALHHDRRVIVEQGLARPREVEIGILGNDAPSASPVGEITFDSEWYDYTTKYTEGRSTMHIPAEIPPEVAQRVRDLALAAYRHLDCAGFARVDFFFTPSDGQVYLNELNTIPGFTPFSMFTKLWEAAGMSYADVVKRLVDLALERHRD